MFPIFVSSKLRAESGDLFKILESSDFEYTIFIEPNEVQSYLKRFPRQSLFVLGEDDAGLAFSRQSILEYARRNKVGWYWLIDDDVEYVIDVSDGCQKVPPSVEDKVNTFRSVVGKVEEDIKAVNSVWDKLAIVSLEYRERGWSAKKPYTLNSYCDVMVAINVNSVAGIDYDLDLPLKVDRDFTLSCLSSGNVVLRFTERIFSTKGIHANGGLEHVYESDLPLEAVEKMEKKWPDVCKVFSLKRKTRCGEKDLRINWRRFDSVTRRKLLEFILDLKVARGELSVTTPIKTYGVQI